MIKTIQVEVRNPRIYLDENLTYTRATTYGSGSTQSEMHVTLLRHRTGTGLRFPCIVWIGGGGWATADHNNHIPELVGFAEAGYVVASVQYRLAGEARFPAGLEDVKACIRFLRANAEEFCIDPERIGVWGESAGGHYAALVATTGDNKVFDKGVFLDQSSAVQAAVCWYPPVNFKSMAEQLAARAEAKGQPKDTTGKPDMVTLLLNGNPLLCEDKVAFANPLTYLTKNAPPTLIMHGTADNTVPIEQGELLHDALEAAGIPVTMYKIEGAPHASLEFYQPETKKIVLEFFDSILKK
ncbi:MAG: alpha/beta hydrolase [Clostridia bacterium]|nr:alpha/beta hydrolase [Clostridia bacterium]MBQ9988754.1 alpha/beta hydrolase [Clostridia bacterium]